MEADALAWIEKLGFPAWSAALIYAVVKINTMFRDLIQQLSESTAGTERRLALLERIAEQHEKAIERHEDLLLRRNHDQ